LTGIQLEGLIGSSKIGHPHTMVSQRLSYGGRIFLGRSRCLLGGFSRIDCQLEGIYFEQGFFPMSPNCVFVVVAWLKQRIIYFWVATFLVLFGILFESGLVSTRRIRRGLWIIFYSLATYQVRLNQSVLLCYWFGLRVLG